MANQSSSAAVMESPPPVLTLREVISRCLDARRLKRMISNPYVVTPTAAKELLLQTNKRNRSLSQARVAEYAAQISSGDWESAIAQGISFSKNGTLNNGQHRLYAVIKADLEAPFYVTFGESEEAYEVTDHAKPRTTADTIGVRYHDPHPRQVVAVIRAILASEQPQPRGRVLFGSQDIENRRKLTGPMNESLSIARKFKHQNALGKAGVAAAHYAILTHSKHAFTQMLHDGEMVTMIDAFFDGIAKGVNLSKTDPRFVLREAILNHITQIQRGGAGNLFSDCKHSKPVETMALLIKTWNLFSTNKTRQKAIRWLPGEKFPVVDDGIAPIPTATPKQSFFGKRASNVVQLI